MLPADGEPRATILRMARDRGPAKTIWPSDAARAVGGAGWREFMDGARDAARELARAGAVEITQGARCSTPTRPGADTFRIRARDAI